MQEEGWVQGSFLSYKCSRCWTTKDASVPPGSPRWSGCWKPGFTGQGAVCTPLTGEREVFLRCMGSPMCPATLPLTQGHNKAGGSAPGEMAGGDFDALLSVLSPDVNEKAQRAYLLV